MGANQVRNLPVEGSTTHSYIPQGQPSYEETLRVLSEGSVNRHFEPFIDIDWENPDYTVSPDDERWMLGPEDNLGAHPWYQSLPKERQIEIGFRRSALVAKVGSQFEEILIAGIAVSNLFRKNNDPAFRYTTHEANEETNHTQMFQEYVNRTGLDVEGMPKELRLVLAAGAVAAAVVAPEILWTGVLAGEEPIDHAQKEVLRKQENQHPLLRRIMQIHVTEEARHISFAHLDLTRRASDLNLPRKALLTVAYPVIMRVLGDAILKPSTKELEQMGIPRDVAKEIWWAAPESRALRQDLFTDARMLADNLGIRDERTVLGRTGKEMWRAMGIDGRPARFRGEPAPPHRPTAETSPVRSGLRVVGKVGGTALRVVGIGGSHHHERTAA